MVLLWRMLLGSLRDLTPVVVVILFFQTAVLRQPLTDLLDLVEGALLVVAGLTLLVYGLQLAVFPLGEALAYALAEKGSLPWLIVFAFLLGFGVTFAEPNLTAVAAEAASAAAAGGAIESTDTAMASYALGLRLTVAVSVGCALILGVSRIIFRWSLLTIVAGCYAAVAALSFVAPPETMGFAMDAGGVTTSVITVPLVTALGIGLASSLSGRNTLTDGFGMIVIIIVIPMLFLLGFATILAWI